MKHIITLLLLTGCTALTAPAQTETTKMQPGQTPEGVTYYLPKTAVRLSVLVEKTTFQPGEYSRYAERYLHVKDARQQPETTHRILSVSHTVVGVPDTAKCYTVKLKGKSVGSNVQMSEEGILLAVNAEAQKPQQAQPFCPARHTVPVDPHRFFGADILRAGSHAKQAELTAQQIFDLRESKNLLITGEADNLPKDGEQLRLMLSRLEEQENALLSMFIGTTLCDTTEHIIELVPEGEVQREVLFRLSSRLGWVDKDDLSGAPVYLTITDLQHTAKPQDEQGDGRKDGGIYANVPGKIRLTLQQGNHLLYTTELYAAQYGFVELLGGQLFRRFTTRLTLHPATGAVDKLEADMPK